MSIEHVSNMAHFQRLLSSAGPKLVVVDFHATWCGPCHAIAPAFESLAREYTGRACFLKVDVDAAADVAQSCFVTSMPTFHGYMRGSRVFSFSGADKNQLAGYIAQHAPAGTDVAFAGAGQSLGSSSGAPTVDWDAKSPEELRRDVRSAAAAAAARRIGAAEGSAADAAGNEATVHIAGSSDKAATASSANENTAKEAAAPTENEVKKQNDEAKSDATDVAEATAEPDSAKVETKRVYVNKATLDCLKEMGFPEVRAVKALVCTANGSAETAMEWCFEHSEDADIDEPLQDVSILEPVEVEAKLAEEKAKSQLSPEERKKKADELVAKARAKRIAEERAAEVEREKNRIRVGKEVSAARAAAEANERKRMIEERRREKLAVIEERRKIREQIAADKEARRQKFNMGPPPPTTAAEAVAGELGGSSVSKGEGGDEMSMGRAASAGKIQFRLPDGSRIEGSFDANNTIADAVAFVAKERPELIPGQFKLMQQYPKRQFTDADMNVELSDTQLLPRGALSVSFL